MNEERGEWASTTLPAGWDWMPFQSVFEDVTDSARKLPQKDYAKSGVVPVVDQGEEFLGGYTDNEGLVHTMRPPFIVFGDHTRCVKYVDFPFVQGADGIKTLKPKKGIDARYGYYASRAIALPDKGYSRHMKFLRASSFRICSEEEQRRIVARLDDVLGCSKNAREDLYHIPRLIKRYKEAVLKAAFTDAETVTTVLTSLGAVAEEVRNGVSRKPESAPPGIPMLKISAVRAINLRMTERRYLRSRAG